MRLLPLSILTWGCLSFQALAGPIHNSNSLIHHRDDDAGALLQYNSRQESSSTHSTSPLLSNATTSDIDAARLIVKHAIAEMTILNKARLENPIRNQYRLRPGTKIGKRDGESSVAPAPLLNITAEIARAAALVAEAGAQAELNGSSVHISKRAGTFWMESIDRKGTVPWGSDASYKASIFRDDPYVTYSLLIRTPEVDLPQRRHGLRR